MAYGFSFQELSFTIAVSLAFATFSGHNHGHASAPDQLALFSRQPDYARQLLAHLPVSAEPLRVSGLRYGLMADVNITACSDRSGQAAFTAAAIKPHLLHWPDRDSPAAIHVPACVHPPALRRTTSRGFCAEGVVVAPAGHPARGEMHAVKNFLQAKTFRRRPLRCSLSPLLLCPCREELTGRWKHHQTRRKPECTHKTSTPPLQNLPEDGV